MHACLCLLVVRLCERERVTDKPSSNELHRTEQGQPFVLGYDVYGKMGALAFLVYAGIL